MKCRSWQARAAVVLALLNAAVLSAQSPRIVIEQSPWYGNVYLVFRAEGVPADSRAAIYSFFADRGWFLTGCSTPSQTSTFTGKYYWPAADAQRFALFILPATASCLNTSYAESLPFALTELPVQLIVTRPSVYPKAFRFAGYDWTVKRSNGFEFLGPGPNLFCEENAFVDAQGKLHLVIQPHPAYSTYSCSAEVILQKPLGYGKYKFTVETPLSAIHRNAVLGMFTWSADAAYPHREIDVELSQWAGTVSTNSQFVVQPYWIVGNMLRFPAPTAANNNVYSFDWAPGSVQFAGPGTTFEVTGSGVPVTNDETVRFNLYWYLGQSGGGSQEVVLSGFEFTPTTRIAGSATTDLALNPVSARGLRLPVRMDVPEVATLNNLPPQVRAARIGSTNNFDLTVMPNWSSSGRSWSNTVGSGPRYWLVNQLGATGTVEQRTVQMLYYNLFGRMPSDAERDFQVIRALHAGASVGELATRMFTAPEFQVTGYFAAGLYAGLLCRDPEYTGWMWQRDAMQSGLQSQRGLVSSFVNSQEFALRHGTDNESMVRGVYRCALGRVASDAEVQFQLNALAGGLSKTDFALSVLNSPEFRLMTDKQVTAFLLYATLLNRDASAAEKAGWVNVLRSTPLRNVIDGFVNSPEFSLGLQ